MIKSIANDSIDMVQKGKQQFVTTFVKHDGLADTMNKFIEAQSQYTKQAFDTGMNCFLDFGILFSKKDFTKELVSAYGLDKFVPAPMCATPVKAASKKAK
jgi:hypothetical protein